MTFSLSGFVTRKNVGDEWKLDSITFWSVYEKCRFDNHNCNISQSVMENKATKCDYLYTAGIYIGGNFVTKDVIVCLYRGGQCHYCNN